jgi:general secretion pathway protein D
VLIVAPKRVVDRWKQLITLADQREPVVTKTYTPKLFSVKEVGSLIQQIAGAVGGAGGGAAGGSDERFKVVIEEPTGSLIVTATPAQHERIEALMQRLDAVPGEARRPVRSFVVRNRPVTEFAATLQRLISAGVLEGNVDGAGGGSPSNGPPSGMGQTPSMNMILPPGSTPLVPTLAAPAPPAARPSGVSRSQGGAQPLAITLTADEPTNTIIAVGDGRLLDQLDALIKTLDVRQPQVMLEAVLVSMAEDDSVALGVEMSKLSTNGTASILLSSLFGIGPTASTAPTPFGGAAPAGLAGGTALVINPGDYSVVINALQKVKNGRTVSLPKVLVANNQKATFNSVRQEPYAASFTAGNSSSPTTSFGGTQDAGTQLTIRPQISEGGGLLLDYNISISQFAGSAASANVPPPRQVTSVQSLATIPDGYTVVVGGLEAFSEGENADQLPLLSQIPLVGELFKNQVKSKTKSKFYVFIHASVMRDQSLEALRYTSDVNANSAGLPASWPRSTPQVVR